MNFGRFREILAQQNSGNFGLGVVGKKNQSLAVVVSIDLAVVLWRVQYNCAGWNEVETGQVFFS